MSRPSLIRDYVFREFLKRFIPAFVVLFLIFVLQTFWVYFDELAGKGLSMRVILKFFYYFSPNIVLYALPIAILLSGIMTYGALGEKNELAAIKSAGVSIADSMKKLIVFNIFLLIGVFVFVNTVQPRGNLKFTRLRVAIARKMPSAVIRQGRFSEIGDFSIKVRRKYGEDDRLLEDIIIHQEVGGLPDKVITARHGEFRNDPRTGYLQLKLYDGEFFEDLTRRQRKSKDRARLPALQSRFKEYVINIDLSGMNELKEGASSMKLYHMLNMKELSRYIDSLSGNLRDMREDYYRELLRRHLFDVKGTRVPGPAEADSLLELTPGLHNSILTRAHTKAQGHLNYVRRKNKFFYKKQTFLNKYIYTYHEKIALPFYIFLLFLVGIPLGAMIRKGGFGLPFVLGIIIYAAFYMLNMLGKSMAEEGLVPPWLGAWLPVLVLLPPVIWMIYAVQTTTESKWINRLKIWLSRLGALFRRRSVRTDAVFVPAEHIPLKAGKDYLYAYRLERGTLLYKRHTPSFARFFRYLEDLLRRTGAPFVAGYWKPPSDFARREGILGDVLMVRLSREGEPVITTDLDVNYRYDGESLHPDPGGTHTFVHYKEYDKPLSADASSRAGWTPA
ncbi:MAG: YjgP/YjgQ family permease [Chlorobi bacterium]|nr:YjgP/YjgQ family permease [Chlorobiota bacterium]